MKIENFSSFGWIIQKCSAAAGYQFDIVNKRLTDTKRLSAQTIHTSGRMVGHYKDDPSTPSLERATGFATDNLPNPLPKLHLNMTVQEDAVWWCVSVPSNKTLPAVTFLRLQENEEKEFPAGSLIFICTGSVAVNDKIINAPASIRTQNNSVVKAAITTYGMIFDREQLNV